VEGVGGPRWLQRHWPVSADVSPILCGRVVVGCGIDRYGCAAPHGRINLVAPVEHLPDDITISEAGSEYREMAYVGKPEDAGILRADLGSTLRVRATNDFPVHKFAAKRSHRVYISLTFTASDSVFGTTEHREIQKDRLNVFDPVVDLASRALNDNFQGGAHILADRLRCFSVAPHYDDRLLLVSSFQRGSLGWPGFA